MKEKAETPESILSRAEKLFAKENYALAKAEFEKAGKMVDEEDVLASISEKIEVCIKELDKLKAKELLKKAKKLLQKNSLRDAVRCYEEAYGISGEAWVLEKLEELRTELVGQDASKAAREAEAAGNYLRAAQMYEQAFSVQRNEDFLVGKARCLVKAQSYQEAVEAFESADLAATDVLSDPAAAYDYGFALAKIGRYYNCLKIWEGVDSRDQSFLEQQEIVRSLLAEDLLDRFDLARDFAALYKEGNYLLNCLKGQGASDAIKTLVEHCKYALIDSLWEEEQYDAIAKLLLPFPAEMTSALLAICAKTFYKVAETNGTHLADLTLFWLTALYDRDLFATLSCEAEEREKVRSALIHRVENLIKRLANSGNKAARKEMAYWKLERQLMEGLNLVVAGRGEPGSLICTPRFAERFAKSAEMRELIRNSEDSFTGSEQFLTMGGYYTPARESLYLLESGDFDEAMARLPGLRSDEAFTHFSILKVSYLCGLHYVESEGGRPGRFFEATAALFDIIPRYEEELAKKALDAYELEQLNGYEDILSQIHRIRPSKRITEALSVVMSTRAMELYDRNKMNSKTLETILKKALKLFPDNEQARITLSDARAGLEIMELEKAMSRHKMSKAFRIAQESQYESVREHYFSFLGELVESLSEADITMEEKLFFLEDLREWCARMDPSHPLLHSMDSLLNRFQSYGS